LFIPAANTSGSWTARAPRLLKQTGGNKTSSHRRAAMNQSHFRQFLAECIEKDGDPSIGLTTDELYGLYTSWCLIQRLEPQPGKSFWANMRAAGIGPRQVNHRILCPSLRMRGPAAADYILASQPDLI
jgi:hypothetical protein